MEPPERPYFERLPPATAQAVQAEKTGATLVQVNLAPAFNIPSGDRVV